MDPFVPALEELSQALTAGEDPEQALAESAEDHSLAAHAKAAEEAQLRCSILPLDRLEFDIDTAEDVSEVLDRAGATPGEVAVQPLRAGGLGRCDV